MPTITRTLNLTDRSIEAMLDFGTLGTYRDARVRGLLLRVGKRGAVFDFYYDTYRDGDRVVTSKRLGQFLRGREGFGVAQARREAEKVAGQLASGRGEPGRKKAQRFDAALDAYLDYLREHKSAEWARNAENMGKLHLRPKWSKRRLSDMSKHPSEVADWHKALTRDVGPAAANNCCRLVRAVYLRAARTDTSLRRDRPPTTAVVWNEELPREVGIDDWRAWATAWRAIPNETRKAYHLFALLSGARPGEAARLRVDALDAKRRTLTIKKSKSGIDVTIPLSVGIVQCLRMARRARGDDPSPYVFVARGPKGHPIRFDKDGLPAYANALRHSYISVAASIGIDELTQNMLTTHAPRGVHQRYFVRMIVSAGPAMRQAQAKISKRILELLHLKPSHLL